MLTYRHRPTGLQVRVVSVNRATGMARVRAMPGAGNACFVEATIPCADLQADQFDLIPQPQQMTLEG